MPIFTKNSLYFGSNYKSMRVLNKNRHKNSNPKPILQETVMKQHDYYSNRRDSMPVPSIIVSHHTRRQSCPNMAFHDKDKIVNKFQEETSAGHVSTKGTCDSRRQNFNYRGKVDWKILTLNQLKDLKNQIVCEHKAQASEKKGQKMFVSIARSNRMSVAKEGPLSAEPKLSEIGAQQRLLRSISNKKNIVNQIQGQIVEDAHGYTFFCK